MSPTFIETWEAIAGHCGRSSRWCRYAAQWADPLPVYKVGGMVRLDLAEYEARLARRTPAKFYDPQPAETP